MTASWEREFVSTMVSARARTIASTVLSGLIDPVPGQVVLGCVVLC